MQSEGASGSWRMPQHLAWFRRFWNNGCEPSVLKGPVPPGVGIGMGKGGEGKGGEATVPGCKLATRGRRLPS